MHEKRNTLRVVLATVFLITVASCCHYMPSDKDVDEANHIWKELSQQYHFQPDQLYERPLSTRSDILVYGVRDFGEQQKIIEILNRIRKNECTKSIAVTFYSNDKANNGVKTSPPDSPIRRVIIRDPKTIDVGCRNWWTW